MTTCGELGHTAGFVRRGWHLSGPNHLVGRAYPSRGRRVYPVAGKLIDGDVSVARVAHYSFRFSNEDRARHFGSIHPQRQRQPCALAHTRSWVRGANVHDIQTSHIGPVNVEAVNTIRRVSEFTEAC